MKKFFSSEREVKSYSPLDSQISSADFSLVINFPHKIFVPSKPATLQLSKMVWHLKIGQKLRVLGAKTWGVMFFQNFWLKLKGAILGPQNHFWWFQRQNGGFPNGYFGFLKKKLKSESAILRLPNFCSNKQNKTKPKIRLLFSHNWKLSDMTFAFNNKNYLLCVKLKILLISLFVKIIGES